MIDCTSASGTRTERETYLASTDDQDMLVLDLPGQYQAASTPDRRELVCAAHDVPWCRLEETKEIGDDSVFGCEMLQKVFC